VIESDGIFPFCNEVFVKDVEHFEKRHVLVYVGMLVANHPAPVLGILLPPDVESEFHGYL
jgi:hypothetical protein